MSRSSLLFPVLAAFAVASPLNSLVADDIPVLDEELINSINDRNLGWTAARNARFEGVTMGEAKRLLGLKIPETGVSCTHLLAQRQATYEDVPDTFDAREAWPGYIHPIANQAQCGSCWAFAAAEVMSDRFAIFSNGSVNAVLSPQYLVSCDRKDMGCNGGWPQYAADFGVTNGIPTEKCFPYSSAAGRVEACPTTCKDGSPLVLYKYKSWDYCIGVAAMEAAVSTYGPIAVSMAVYQDFFTYSSGIYKYTGGSGLAGYHAVKLVGYGPDYWIVANSWGTTWGEKGFFRIAKGINNCGIELGALDRACPLAGIPAL